MAIVDLINASKTKKLFALQSRQFPCGFGAKWSFYVEIFIYSFVFLTYQQLSLF